MNGQDATTGSPLWTIDEILRATGGYLDNDPASAPPDSNYPVRGISIDSRTLERDHGFFAIKGDRFDGHDFVESALQRGAAIAVISSERAADFAGNPGRRLVVPDVLKALEDLGRAARNRMNGKVIAVTGSVGKTGTKEALRLALAPSGNVHAADKSFNNHWGVPLSLARMPRDAEFGIFEIGMNHPGEIRPLVNMVRPHIALITTVEAVHLEFFQSVEDIARAKAEIFEGVEPGGVVLLNADNAYFGFLRGLAANIHEIASIESFGQTRSADVRVLKTVAEETSSLVSADLYGRQIEYRLGAPGKHLVINSLAVMAAAYRAGADMEKAGAALSAVSAPKGRGERWDLAVGGATAVLIDESYNANPISMRAALDLLGQFEPDGGRRIAVLGDMLELGDDGADLHSRLVESVLDNSVDQVFCCGPLMEALWQRLPGEKKGAYGDNSDALAQPVLNGISPGDVIMIKGSLGSRMGPLVEALLSRYHAVKSGGETP